jgi:hypothetical protein
MSAFQPKPSKASKIWLGIVAVVLIALFFETRDAHQSGQNFVLGTNDEAVGADVLIDNHKIGQVESGHHDGLDGGVFRTYLTSGQHDLSVQKSGFQSFTTHLDMKREAYVGVDLQQSSH